MRRYKIDAVESMEFAARRLEETAEKYRAKGGRHNRDRAHWMVVGAQDLRRDAAEKQVREGRT